MSEIKNVLNGRLKDPAPWAAKIVCRYDEAPLVKRYLHDGDDLILIAEFKRLRAALSSAAVAEREPYGYVDEKAGCFYADHTPNTDGLTPLYLDPPPTSELEVENARLKARIAALEAQLADRVKVKPLDEDDYEEIVNAAGIALRNASYGIRGQVITVHDSLDWWVMKETERRILSALEATPPAPKVTEAMVETEMVRMTVSETIRAMGANPDEQIIGELTVFDAVAVKVRAALTAAQEAGKP